MKKFISSVCFWVGTTVISFGQLVFPISGGSSNRFIVALPTLTAAQNRLLQQAKTAARITVVGNLPNLAMELWQLPSSIPPAALAALEAAARSLRLSVQSNDAYETVPEGSGRSIPRTRVSEMSLTIPSVRAAVWTEQQFLRPCNLGGTNAVSVGIIDGGLSMDDKGRPYGDIRYFDAQGSKDFTGEVTDNSTRLKDLGGHGTHTYGVLNKVFLRLGMATNSKITVLKAFTQNGRAELWHILAAMNHAIDLRLNILSCSFNYVENNTIRGLTNSKFILEQAIEKAREKNILIIASAGNHGNDVDANNAMGYYPTIFTNDNLVTVAATEDSTFLRPTYTNYGLRSVDIAAPGTLITQHLGGDSLYIACGTSFAAPIVAGHAAFLASRTVNYNYAINKYMTMYNLNRNVPTWTGKLNPRGGVLTPLCSSWGYRRNPNETDIENNLNIKYASNIANITYTGNASENGILTVSNMTGQIVATQKITIQQDGESVLNWFADDLQNGIYILHVQIGTAQKAQKIVKTH